MLYAHVPYIKMQNFSTKELLGFVTFSEKQKKNEKLFFIITANRTILFEIN